MNSWIDLTALWQIVVVGLLAGVGLPALFALGMLSLGHQRGGAQVQTAGADSETSDMPLYGGSLPGAIVAGLCFLIVLAAIAWGIVAIYKAGHPHH
jgi:hypothetical protein